MDQAAGPIILIGFVVLGFALFWARHLTYRHRPATTDDVMKLILSIAAWVCVAVGVVGFIVQGLLILAPLGLAVVAGVVLMLVTRYRAAERRALLRCLSIAAQKGIPLNEAARAFAHERSDEIGLRAVRLAEMIEAGMPLPDALTHSGTRLPIDASLALRVGFETGTLSESLRRVARVDVDMDFLLRSVIEKTFYVLWIWVVMLGTLSFIFLKILPVFEKMFREFEVALPDATQGLIIVADQGATFAVLFIPLLLLVLGVTVMGSLYYVDLLPRGAPLIQQLRRRWDAALVMRVLALAVHQQWPMNKTIWMLARLYPVAPIRKRLAQAGRRIDNAENWCDALRHVGLLRNADWAVLQSATRVGNLEWALDEMSDSSVRRQLYRLRIAINFLFPTTLLVCGLVIGYVVVSLFMPLVSLIQGLT